MAKHNDLGQLGEEMVVNYLLGKGYQILERNWRNIHKEIDIIAKNGEELVIVEVKTRQNNDFGNPDIAVTKKKQRLLISAANAYIFKHNLDINTRFDIVSLYFKEGDAVFNHIEDAFLP